LQSATYIRCIYGDRDKLGQSIGKIADIVAVSGDPFDRYFGDENVVFVMKEGKKYLKKGEM